MPFAHPLRTEFALVDTARQQSFPFGFPSFGPNQKTRGGNAVAGGLDYLGFAYDVGLAAEAYHFVPLVFEFKQTWGTLVVLGVFSAAGARKPVVLSVRFNVHVGAVALQSSLVLRSHLRFNDLVQPGP